ncbi:DUF3237 family protein [Pseudomonas syringae]|uniref:DUF3237 family protein n=1 Tax=Pseudomonas syringae TaxID=317 RepID=UPI0004638A52|nr:DUF3237 family protein [Pseudomonas syringae]
METMQLHEILTVRLRLDEPQSLFSAHGGQRRSGEILGGAFEGGRLQGQVLPGGSLFVVPQDEDLARFSLYYTLLTGDGVKIDVVGEGLLAIDETNRAPVAQSHCRCTCSKQFSVPPGAHDYLQRNLYVGRVNLAAVDGGMLISIFQVGEH